MSDKTPNQPSQPDKRDDDELINLNADDLDVQELDDTQLDNVAGGTYEALAEADGCTNNVLC